MTRFTSFLGRIVACLLARRGLQVIERLQWTSLEPHKPGWYWVRERGLRAERIVHFWQASDGRVCSTLMPGFQHEYAGPLPKPALRG